MYDLFFLPFFSLPRPCVILWSWGQVSADLAVRTGFALRLWASEQGMEASFCWSRRWDEYSHPSGLLWWKISKPAKSPCPGRPSVVYSSSPHWWKQWWKEKLVKVIQRKKGGKTSARLSISTSDATSDSVLARIRLLSKCHLIKYQEFTALSTSRRLHIFPCPLYISFKWLWNLGGMLP